LRTADARRPQRSDEYALRRLLGGGPRHRGGDRRRGAAGARRDVAFGPRFDSVWQPLLASAKSIAEALVQVNNVYELGRRAEIIAFAQPLEDALSTYSTDRWGHLLV